MNRPTMKVFCRYHFFILLAVYQFSRFSQLIITWSKNDNNYTSSNDVDAGYTTPTQPYRIIHVIVLSKENDGAQNDAITSLQLAHSQVTSPLSVTLAATTYYDNTNSSSSDSDKNKENDKSSSHVLPSSILSLPPLRRDISHIYPRKEIKRHVPLLQDVFDCVLRAILNFDYIIVTSEDMVMKEDFYERVWQHGMFNKEWGYDAFTFDAVDAQVAGSELLMTEGDDVDNDRIDRLKGMVVKRTVLEKLDTGNLFMGGPLWDDFLSLQLEYFAQRWHHFSAEELTIAHQMRRKNESSEKMEDDYNESETYLRKEYKTAYCSQLRWMAFCQSQTKHSTTCQKMTEDIQDHVSENFNWDKTKWCRSSSSPVEKRSQATLEKKIEPLLSPPYRIVQAGSPRSGSTFQYHLLRAILSLKTKHHATIVTHYIGKGQWHNFTYTTFRQLHPSHHLLVKTHDNSPLLKSLQERKLVTVFASGSSTQNLALYTQSRQHLVHCPACEIQRYKPFFNLTDEQIEILTEYMGHYTKLRQCCGYQMSKYEVLRLNGCDVSQYKRLSDYPHCEKFNLKGVERAFDRSPIKGYKALNPDYEWGGVGDCERMNGKIRSEGKGFNGRNMTSCKLDGKFAGSKVER